MYFKFLDFEITPNLEEISGFADVPLREGRLVHPSSMAGEKILTTLRVAGLPLVKELRRQNSDVGLPFSEVWSL